MGPAGLTGPSPAVLRPAFQQAASPAPTFDAHSNGATAPTHESKEDIMRRFIVERSFPEGLDLPISETGARTAHVVIDRNAEHGVTWIQSYFTPDRTKSFCVYDGPSEEAIVRSAECNGLPVERVTEIRVLDPYFLT